MTRQKNRIHLILALLLGVTLLHGITPARATGPCVAPAICVFENGALRFGNGTENSINEFGLFRQPFYKSADGNWYQLTFSDYPLDMAIGSGTGGPNWTGNTVVDLSDVSGGMDNQVIDYSNFIVTSTSDSISKGYGKIVVTGEFTINGTLVQVKNTYELGLTDKFVKATTALKNINPTAGTLTNTHIWVGTRDDFVGSSDRPKKRRGNLTESGGFQVLANATDEAKALEITTDNEGALFYSTTAGTNMAYNQCCSFSNAYNQNPSTSASNRSADVIPGITTGFYDGSYAAVLDFGDIARNAESQIVWFYAAGAIGDLAAVARAVAAAGAPAVPGVTRNDTGVVLTWDEPRASDPITNYSIRYRLAGTDTWTVINRSPASTVRSETITALDNRLAYEFQVSAWTTATTGGAVPVQGDWSGSSAADILGSPTAPTSASAVGGDRSAVISFTNATTNGTESATVTNYQYWLGDPETWTALSPADTSTPITIPGLANGRTYNIQIRAVNAWGAGPSVTIPNVRTLPVFSDFTLDPLIDTGTAYIDSVTATDGVAYSISSGSIPTGLTFNTTTGRFSGTPSASGRYTFTITATNSAGSISRTYTLATADSPAPEPAPVIIDGPSFTSVPTYNAIEGARTSITFNANRADYYEIQGPLPAGLSFDSRSGTLSGVPTTPGTYSVVVIARNEGGGTAATFPFNVAPKPLPPVPALDAITIPEANLGSPYVTVNGAQTPATMLPNGTTNGLEVKATGWNLAISATQTDGKAAPLNAQNQLLIKEKQGIYVAGEGFKPSSEVRVYIFSTAILLGTVTTSAKGDFSALYPIPTTLAEGPHTLQLNGMSSQNDLRSASIPALFEKEKVVTPPADTTNAGSTNSGGSTEVTTTPTVVRTQIVIPFAFNKYTLGSAQRAIIKSLSVKPGAVVRVTGYAQPTSKQPDIAISLDRALEVKLAVAKLVTNKATFKVSGSGPQKNTLCAPYKNKCVVVTITQG